MQQGGVYSYKGAMKSVEIDKVLTW